MSFPFADAAGGPLFIFELANNHMGDVQHGLRIIEELAAATKNLGARGAVKFQYRQLDTFIHPDFRSRTDFKQIKRFQETRLSENDFITLKDAAKRSGFLTVCTAFDEASVGLIEKHGYDIIKVASCSFTDWPLLERIVQTSLPMIASVGGASLEDIDRVVSFFEHRQKQFALMHCVAEYPTPDEHLALNQIDLLRTRYPGVTIGFSTHERPALMDAVKLAVAKGAAILERHVGVATECYSLNAYSSTPAQAADWVRAAQTAQKMNGIVHERVAASAGEISELHALRRGAFAREAIPAGTVIDPIRLLLAMPVTPGQITANDLSKYAILKTKQAIAAGAALMRDTLEITNTHEPIDRIVGEVRQLIRRSNIPLPHRAGVEVSHHYGVERFHETGAVILNFVNRSYCKKLIVMLPGQKHPEHAHKVKEETFFVLYGSMKLSLDGKIHDLTAGDSILLEPGVKHWFSTDQGVIFEEISSMHVAQDSYYSDPVIASNPERKTNVTYWRD